MNRREFDLWWIESLMKLLAWLAVIAVAAKQLLT